MDDYSCPDCGRSFKKSTLLDLHIEKQVTCPNCNKKFCNKATYRSSKHRSVCDMRESCLICNLQVLNMDQHMKRHNSVQKRVYCEHCDKEYCTRTGLITHLENIHPDVKYPCDQCDKSFVIKAEFEVHVESHKGGIECEICKRTFNYKSNYRAHMLLHTNSCPVCKKVFKEESNLQLHIDSQTTCTDCNKVFCSKMAYHAFSHKSICDRRQTCNVCGIKVIQMKEHMLRHTIRLTGERKFPCQFQYCDKSYTSKSEMLNHQKSVHMNVRYQCELCDKSFSYKSYYNSHMESHKGAIECVKCKGSFKNKQNFRRHLRKCDNSAAPCICDICGKELASADTLKRHKITHTGERPYKCEYCTQTFARQSTYKDHVRTHTKEKPHTCPICGKSFIQKTAYNVHMRSHNNTTQTANHVCCICSRSLPTAGLLRAHVKSHGAEML